MPRTNARHVSRRIRATLLQPLLTRAARRNQRTHELAALMQLPCSACGAPLSGHRRAGNWIGCRKVGA